MGPATPHSVTPTDSRAQMKPVAYAFGSYELRPAERLLTRNGVPVSLGARAFDVLVALVEKWGALVTKDELIELAWPGLVVQENNLQVQISTLRKVVGADAIATVSGLGYRFRIPTRRLEPASGALESEQRSALPRQLTRFFGREDEMREVLAQMSSARLLTLTGAGGAGKTRLALQIGAELAPAYPDGVRLAELAPLEDPKHVPRAVARVLGISERQGTDLVETLAGLASEKRLLLILDNCEHVVGGAATLAEALLKGCGGIRILATSREPLRVPGEVAYRVPSLSTPDPTRRETADDLLRYTSVQLFVDRAVAVDSRFRLDAQSAADVAVICHRLDGIPLALELAAARLRSLSVADVSERLDQRFALLSVGARNAPRRHQTLRAMVGWSYDLLSPVEQALLARLAVFSGGWTLAACERVCAGGEVREGDILDLLSSLADKSLVLCEPFAGSTRYRLLETVREFAFERLRDRGEEQAVRRLHLAYCIALAAEAEPHLLGESQQLWLGLLEREHENVRSALAWALGPGADPESAVKLVAAFWRFWWIHSDLVEGYRWIRRVLDAAPRDCAPRFRARVLRGGAGIAFGLAEFAAGRAMDEECLEITRRLGDRQGTARALAGIAQVIAYVDQGDAAGARERYEESLALCRALDDRRGMGIALNGLGNVALFLERDYSRGMQDYQAAFDILISIGDRHAASYALTGLGRCALGLGEPATALVHFRLGAEFRRELHDWRGIAESLDGVGAARAHAHRDVEGAARIWGAVERLREVIGNPLSPSERRAFAEEVAWARALDEGTFDRAWQEGRTLSVEDAIAFALEI